jgi:hypothetical protein
MKQKTNWWYILGTIVLCLSIANLFIACDSNRFTLETKIKPKLTLIGSNVAVQFNLGDLLILDEWKDLNVAQLLYITNGEERIVNLRLQYGDFSVSSDGFYYMIGNTEIFTQPLEWKIISKHISSLPNVVWSVKDSKTISKKTKEEKKVEKDPLKSVDKDNNKDGIGKLKL